MFFAATDTTGHTMAYTLCANLSRTPFFLWQACQGSVLVGVPLCAKELRAPINLSFCNSWPCQTLLMGDRDTGPDPGNPHRLFVSQHPKAEARIVEELRRLGLLATPEQPQPRALEHADLSRLTHLTCAIKVCVRR